MRKRLRGGGKVDFTGGGCFENAKNGVKAARRSGGFGRVVLLVDGVRLGEGDALARLRSDVELGQALVPA